MTEQDDVKKAMRIASTFGQKEEAKQIADGTKPKVGHCDYCGRETWGGASICNLCRGKADKEETRRNRRGGRWIG